MLFVFLYGPYFTLKNGPQNYHFFKKIHLSPPVAAKKWGINRYNHIKNMYTCYYFVLLSFLGRIWETTARITVENDEKWTKWPKNGRKMYGDVKIGHRVIRTTSNREDGL